MMTRRGFVGSLAGGLLAIPLTTEAQKRDSSFHIGLMIGSLLPTFAHLIDALRGGRTAPLPVTT
jgi:hypothetical protein